VALPEIDIGGLREDPGSAGSVVDELLDVCHSIGFCYVSGHGVPSVVERAVMDASARFFAIDDDEKQLLAIANSPHFRGYTALGDERTKGKADWREQLDAGYDEPRSDAGPGDPPWLRLRGPNQWPRSVPELRQSVEAWVAVMEPVALAVLRGLALGLGQPVGFFDEHMLPRGDLHLKIIRYPPVCDPVPNDQGVGWHHDSGLLSFVLQDSVGGLEVMTDNGIVEASPRPGAYVMNLGEMLQAATAGYLRATPHRVVSPHGDEARISVAYFAHPKLESTFGSITLPPALAAEASGGANVDPGDPVFDCFGDNYLKIRLRSHQDIARKFYSDVRGGR
jgi:isopenicillin N synthase-like dioxygenase